MNISSIYNPEQRRIAESLNRVKVTFSSNPEDQKFICNGVGYGLTKSLKKIVVEDYTKQELNFSNKNLNSKSIEGDIKFDIVSQENSELQKQHNNSK